MERRGTWDRGRENGASQWLDQLRTQIGSIGGCIPYGTPKIKLVIIATYRLFELTSSARSTAPGRCFVFSRVHALHFTGATIPLRNHKMMRFNTTTQS